MLVVFVMSSLAQREDCKLLFRRRGIGILFLLAMPSGIPTILFCVSSAQDSHGLFILYDGIVSSPPCSEALLPFAPTVGVQYYVASCEAQVFLWDGSYWVSCDCKCLY